MIYDLIMSWKIEIPTKVGKKIKLLPNSVRATLRRLEKLQQVTRNNWG